MMKIFSKGSLKRKVLISVLSALFVVSAALMGVFALTNKTETVMADNGIAWTKKLGNDTDVVVAEGFTEAGGLGFTHTFHLKTTSAVTQVNNMWPMTQVCYSGVNGFPYDWAIARQQIQGNFGFNFMFTDGGINCAYYDCFDPNNSDGSGRGYINLQTAGVINYYNNTAGFCLTITIRVMQVGGEWKAFLNDKDIDELWSSGGADFSVTCAQYYRYGTTVGVAFGSISRYLGAASSCVEVYANVTENSGFHSLTAADVAAYNHETVLATAYERDAYNFYTEKGEYYSLTSRNGFSVSFNLMTLLRPDNTLGIDPQIDIMFSPDSTLYDSTISSAYGTGRFCVNLNLNRSGLIYATIKHGTNGASSAVLINNTSTLITSHYKYAITFTFTFGEQGKSEFSIKLVCNNNTVTTTSLSSYFMNNVATTSAATDGRPVIVNSDWGINLGVCGLCNAGFCSFGMIYDTAASSLTGRIHSVRSNTSYGADILYNSPVNQITWRGDVGSSAAYVTGMTSSISTALTVTNKAALTDNSYFTVSYGPDTTIMIADTGTQSGITTSHLALKLLYKSSALYATVFYGSAANTASCVLPTVNDTNIATYGYIGVYTGTNGTTNTITISIHKIADSDSYWGIYVNNVLVDSVKTTTTLGSFMAQANKNIAVTTPTTASGLSSFKANIFLPTSNSTYSAPSVVAAQKISLCDLYAGTASGSALKGESISANGRAFWYNSNTDKSYGTTLNTDSINYEFKGNYSTSRKVYINYNNATTRGVALLTSNTGYITPHVYNGADRTFQRYASTTFSTSTSYVYNIKQERLASDTKEAASNTMRVTFKISNGSGTIYAYFEYYGSVTKYSASNRAIYNTYGSTMNTTIARTTFKGPNAGGTSLERKNEYRTEIGDTYPSAPEALSVDTYCTGSWRISPTDASTVYVEGATVTASKTYTWTQTMDNTSEISAQLNAVSSGALVAKSGLWRDSVSGDMSTTKGYLAFMHNMSKTLYNSLESAVSSGKISGFKVYVLFGQSSSTDATPTATNYKLRATCVDTTNETKLIYGADSSNYSFVGYIGIGVANKSVVFRSVLCVEITQLDGTTTSVCTTYNSSQGRQSLSGAAGTAVSSYSNTLTAAQKAAIANYQ